MNTDSSTIVLIHGQWMTSKIWKGFQRLYEAQGYRVYAPAWPRMRGDVEEIRRNPAVLNGLGIAEIAEHYEAIVRSLPERPILMGHALGGLIVQLLLDRGLGSAGVSIDGLPPKGVWQLPWPAIRAASPVLKNPLHSGKTISLTFEQFRYAFANVMTEGEARAAYERYAVPGPARPIFEQLLSNFNRWAPNAVNRFCSSRAPLLLIAGTEDHQVPAVQNRENFRKYLHSRAVTEYKEFPHRSHLILAQDGWQEVAEYALAWAEYHHWRSVSEEQFETTPVY